MRSSLHRRVKRRLALGGCLLALGCWAAAASAAETACRVVGTMKFDVGKTVCIPSARNTWLVCTGASAPSGGGAWKDTGVPCSQAQPKSPADYRAVPAGPHPSSPVAGKRVIDGFRGIVFRCQPSTNLSWSADACARITAEMLSAAKSAGVTVIVVVDALDDAAASAKKAEAAGLKLDEAIDWTVLLRATDSGGAVFKQDVNGVTEVVPGIYDRRPLLLASDAYLNPGSADLALAEAKTDFAGDFEILARPR